MLTRTCGSLARGEALLVTREATNPLDKHAVAIYKEDIFVGRVPYNLAPRLSQFSTHYRPVDMAVRLPRISRLTGCLWQASCLTSDLSGKVCNFTHHSTS